MDSIKKRQPWFFIKKDLLTNREYSAAMSKEDFHIFVQDNVCMSWSLEVNLAEWQNKNNN